MKDVLLNIDLQDWIPLFMLGAPLAVFASLMLFGRKIKKFRGIYATIVMFISLVLSIVVFVHVWPVQGVHVTEVPWFQFSGIGKIDFNLHLDAISSLFIVIVLLTSFLVHLFSIEYLRGEDHFEKYFAYLGLFVFSILGVILAQNLFVVFCFWELVGFSSYLLIGFYYKKESAVFANKKAFIVNRVGDVGFIIALLTIYSSFGTLNIEELVSVFRIGASTGFDTQFMNSYQLDSYSLYLIGGGILSGAVAKSSQFPLNVWLPNAMEGPTPVSALIHAATMVAAGVYLIIRTYFLFSPEMLDLIAFIGAITAFMGAFVAMSQRDIKKVLAFSTISQLGYMFLSLGVRSLDGAMFHLMTHAFFKACLFLGAGAIIYSLHKLEYKKRIEFDTQDMSLMGGLRKHMPTIFVFYLVAAIALVGLPFTSGFLSKEAILVTATNWGMERGGVYLLVPLLGIIGVLMTAFYMGRQIFLVFFSENRLQQRLKLSNEEFLIDKAPVLMRLPVVILGSLSLWVFYSFNPLDAHQGWFFKINESFDVIRNVAIAPLNHISYSHVSHTVISIVSLSLVSLGVVVSWYLYVSKNNPSVTGLKRGLLNHSNLLYKLSFNNWYLDEFYVRVFVWPFGFLSMVAVFFDKVIVGGFIIVLKELTLYMSRMAARFDKYILSNLVDFFGQINVVFAMILGFIDRWVIDGLVRAVVYMIGKIGMITKTIQLGNAQSFVTFSILGLVVLLVLVFNVI